MIPTPQRLAVDALVGFGHDPGVGSAPAAGSVGGSAGWLGCGCAGARDRGCDMGQRSSGRRAAAQAVVEILEGRRLLTSFTRADYPAGNYANAIAAADFDGDGWNDMVVIRSSGTTVGLYHNNGDGTFAAPVEVEAGYGTQVLTADFNGDGTPDIALLGWVPNLGNAVTVLLNNGDGTFAAGIHNVLAQVPTGMSAGDLNGDGKADVVIANPALDTLSVFVGQGDGRFAPEVQYATGDSPWRTRIADLDGDGRPDLVTNAEGSHALTVLLNQGDGTFADRADYTTPAGRYSPSTVMVADLNGDGRMDLAANTESGVSAFLNRGDGTFAPRMDIAVGPYWSLLAAADVTGDRMAELVGWTDSHIAVLVNDGDGTFSPTADPVAANYTGPAIAADFNADGKLDIAILGGLNSTMGVLLNTTPYPPSDLALSIASVVENQPTGTTVGVFTATDPERADSFLYTLVAGEGDADNGRFIIDGDALITGAPFDYEVRSSYSIRARVTDADGHSFEKAFTISITDLPDTLGRFGLVEGKRRSFVLTESDGGRITFSLTGGGMGMLDANHTLVLRGTTARSVLTIRVNEPRNADGYYALYGITADGPLKGILAPRVSLHGDVAPLDGDIVLNTSAMPVGKAAVTIHLASGFNASIRTNGVPIRSLSAHGWSRRLAWNEQIVAPWVGSITLSGPPAHASREVATDPAMSGNLEMDVLTSASDRGRAIGRIKVRGGIYDARIWAAGKLGGVYAREGLFSSDIAAAGSVGTISVGLVSYSSVLVGVAEDFDQAFVGSAGGFADPSAKLSSLSIRGGTNHAGGNVVNSHVSAPLIGKVSLVDVGADTGRFIHVLEDVPVLTIRKSGEGMIGGGSWKAGRPGRPEIVEILG